MIVYNLCLIKQQDSILLLNRERAAWMGRWNGVGGKLEAGEKPRQAMVREIEEETQLTDYQLHYKGVITWEVDQKRFGGMYLYLATVANDFIYETPRKVEEGILDWKSIDWILDPNNQGVATNISRFLPPVLETRSCNHYHCNYRGEEIEDVQISTIGVESEQKKRMETHMQAFLYDHNILTLERS